MVFTKSGSNVGKKNSPQHFGRKSTSSLQAPTHLERLDTKSPLIWLRVFSTKHDFSYIKKKLIKNNSVLLWLEA